MSAFPALFLGHGNPMNAIQPNEYTRAWDGMGKTLPRPRAILCISAHWYVAGARVTAQDHPRTIHDFGGFPRELYEMRYPAPGSPELAKRVCDLLAPERVEMDTRWGLDHGAWSLLAHLYPVPSIPVVQLGIDDTLTAEQHFELARRLRPLRDEEVLILGSGDVVHNLHAYAWGRHPQEPYDWAVRFERRIRGFLEERDFESIVRYEGLGRDAELSAPTPDHFLPLLYVVGVASREEPVSFPVEGFDGGSVSMLAVRFG